MWESAFVLGLTIKPKLYQLIVTKRCDLLDWQLEVMDKIYYVVSLTDSQCIETCSSVTALP